MFIGILIITLNCWHFYDVIVYLSQWVIIIRDREKEVASEAKTGSKL